MYRSDAAQKSTNTDDTEEYCYETAQGYEHCDSGKPHYGFGAGLVCGIGVCLFAYAWIASKPKS